MRGARIRLECPEGHRLAVFEYLIDNATGERRIVLDDEVRYTITDELPGGGTARRAVMNPAPTRRRFRCAHGDWQFRTERLDGALVRPLRAGRSSVQVDDLTLPSATIARSSRGRRVNNRIST